MDITPDNVSTQPISDDQELAKALAGISPDEPDTPTPPAEPEMQFEETPASTTTPAVPPVVLPTPNTPTPTPTPTAPPTTEAPATPETPPSAPVQTDTGLEGIKNAALEELRPLIDRVDLPVEEKFNTYLMLIRSTDDSSLIAPAHAAAQAITDEKRKAEALLEIIKEIDYLSRKDQPTT
tara:strand:- start:1276 stop:1815 length:540 start_codon:yes stop_codon:yes gene_type:complete